MTLFTRIMTLLGRLLGLSIWLAIGLTLVFILSVR